MNRRAWLWAVTALIAGRWGDWIRAYCPRCGQWVGVGAMNWWAHNGIVHHEPGAFILTLTHRDA